MVGSLEKFAEERGHTVAQLAVAWTLAHPGVHVAIVGARRPDHIEDTAAAADLELDRGRPGGDRHIMADAVTVGGPFPEM